MTAIDLHRFRLSLGLFVIGLVLSGLTAFPLLTEIRLLGQSLNIGDPADYASYAGLRHWIAFVWQGLEQTYRHYPFIGYGTDWLAFGHLVIALFFIGPWREPVANAWVLRIGLIACASVIPLALIGGAVRAIPVSWRLIDCSFGIFGAVPLAYCLRLIQRQRAAVM